MENIGDRMKILRKNECLMTQAEFAKTLGVTNAHISKIEKGLTTPSEALIKLICKTFSVSEYWLKDGIMPIYIEDLITESDDNMEFATNETNKLLRSENLLVRLTATKLQTTFANITNADAIKEDKKLAYLKTLLNLFECVDEITDTFKRNSESISERDIEIIIDFNIRRIELELREILDLMKND